MIRRLRIRDFQSLRDVSLDLGKLTVIVGASSSGKSAVIRAVRTLAQNSSSSAFVSVGAKRSSIDAVTDEGAVRLLRGRGESTYEVATHELGKQRYPKCATTTPDVVRAVLRLPEAEGELLGVADQFDRPFLLSESGTKVSRVLGDLTNINVLLEASREANRRRLGVTSELKMRRGDLESSEDLVAQHADVPARVAALEEARALVDRAREASARAAQLRSATEAVDALRAHLDAVRAEPEPPDVSAEIQAAEKLAARAHALRVALQIIALEAERVEAQERDVSRLRTEISEAKAEYDELLRSVGTCPVCGSKT